MSVCLTACSSLHVNQHEMSLCKVTCTMKVIGNFVCLSVTLNKIRNSGGKKKVRVLSKVEIIDTLGAVRSLAAE